MIDPVPPHEDFVDGVAVHDVGLKMGPRVRVYMPEVGLGDDPIKKLPVILHFYGGGFCLSKADWFMYYAFYSKLAQLGRVIVVSVYLRLALENRLPAAIDDGFSALLGLLPVLRPMTHGLLVMLILDGFFSLGSVRVVTWSMKWGFKLGQLI